VAAIDLVVAEALQGRPEAVDAFSGGLPLKAHQRGLVASPTLPRGVAGEAWRPEKPVIAGGLVRGA
jgi:hypothetical protein